MSDLLVNTMHQLFHKGGSYNIEINPLICCVHQLTGFYITDRHERVIRLTCAFCLA